MNPSTENAMVQEGILSPSGETDRNKLNLISNATIPQFCDFFWETSLRDKELVTRLRPSCRRSSVLSDRRAALPFSPAL